MHIRIGVIIIGSLFWDHINERGTWRANELKMEDKILVDLPIRYGRYSEISRKGTYSMVFSNNVNQAKTMGKGYIVPFKQVITTQQEFVDKMISLSKAEGISNNRICKSWGTVCLIENPFTDKNRKNQISYWWDDLVNATKRNLTRNQREPELNSFGEPKEQKSIDESWRLTFNMNNLFSNQLKDFDALVATSNAVKLSSKDENKYPTIKQIAKAINDNGYFEYFLRNTQNSIRTFQDRKIARILKRKYRISLKDERKKCENIIKPHLEVFEIVSTLTSSA